MKAISDELQPLLGVVAAVLDPAGILLEANTGFMQLLGAGPGRRIGVSASACFDSPGFRELVAVKPAAGGEVFRGTLRLRDAQGGVVELRGRVWRSAYGLCVLAEGDIPALQSTQHELPADSRQQAQREMEGFGAPRTDKLTGTGTGDRLDEALATEIGRVRRTGLPLGILMASPDGLANVIEKHGQDEADKVLARFGFLLRLLTRPTDIATRVGAQEFAVVLPHTNLAQAAAAAERVRKSIETDESDGVDVSVTGSFGVAEFKADESAASFVSRASGALRLAGETGSNKVVAATD